MNKSIIQVVLIEDDPMVQEVNKQFVERVHGFKVVGIANNGIDGVEKIRKLAPELAILDIYMPGQNGMDTLKQIRREQLAVDVIVITAANDIQTIQSMLQNGAIDYIMKPFKFERVRQALEQYRALNTQLTQDNTLTQSELDRLLMRNAAPVAGPKEQAEDELPKGLQELTMKQILLFLMNQSQSLSAEEVAEGVGLARVTARRYLDHLVKKKAVKLDMQYGGVGRPINRYLWVK
jgi:two-component system, CitB family, response regulator DctR